jgi:PAS domain S-box-containing protein
MDWHDTASDLVLVGAALGALFFLVKKVVVPFFAMMNGMVEYRHKLDVVFDEMTPNHGTSIKDAVQRMEGTLDTVRHQVVYNGEALRAWWLGSPVAMYETDMTGRLLWCNKRYADIVGYEFPELEGLGYMNIIAEGDRQRVREESEAATKDCRMVDMAFRLTKGNGKVHAEAYPLRHEEKCIGYLGTLKELEEDV